MNESKIKRLIYLCETAEKEIEYLKSEILMAMILEQQNLIDTKYDRTNYHYHGNSTRTNLRKT